MVKTRREVLIVEDQKLNREMLQDILEPDYATVCVGNGLEALNILLDNGGGTPQQKNNLTRIFKELQNATDAIQNYHYDDLFHGEIMAMANNSRLTHISNQMRLQIYRARWLSVVLPNRIAEAAQEHESIYQALMDDDRQASVQSLTLHLDRSEQNFKKVLSDPRYNPQFNLAMAHITTTYHQRQNP